MDLAQAARMIEWLDEERRRDRSTIALLEERLAQQDDLIIQLERRLNGMENEQSTMRTTFLPVGREIEIGEQLRVEFQQMIETTEGKRIDPCLIHTLHRIVPGDLSVQLLGIRIEQKLVGIEAVPLGGSVWSMDAKTI